MSSLRTGHAGRRAPSGGSAPRNASVNPTAPGPDVDHHCGDLELRIAKVPSGKSFFPSLLERRRRVDQALFAATVAASLHGVAPRTVDDLVKALGLPDLCRSRRHLLQVPGNRRVVSHALVIATGVTADGRREVLGFDVGDSEGRAFWTAFTQPEGPRTGRDPAGDQRRPHRP